MGILSDFVVAKENEGEAIGESIRPAEQWPTLEGWKGIETIKLATLYCAISGAQYSNDLQSSFELAGGDQNEGPWVFEFPQAVTDALAGLAASSVPAVAAKWTQTDELVADGWQTSEAEEFIKQINSYATLAAADGKKLYLWLSL